MTAALVARAMRVSAVLTLLPAALFVAGAQVASADAGVADGRFTFGVGGLVGMGAVVLGLGGLVAGLFRRRKLTAARMTAPLPAPQPEPARSETAA